MEYRIKRRLGQVPTKYDFPFFTMETRVIYMLQKKCWFGWWTINDSTDKQKIENQFNELTLV